MSLSQGFFRHPIPLVVSFASLPMAIQGQQILQILFSFLPLSVCLFWALCYIAHFRQNDASKHFMTVYLLTCVVLYFCHALFFTVGLPYSMECIWTLCSLSVYPLFYGYLCRLTSRDYTVAKLWPWLVPGALVALAKYVFPDAGIDRVRLVLFATQIVTVCYFGIRKLKAFDSRVKAVYADIEGRDTTDVHYLLVAIIVVSILSGVANTIGKAFFSESLWLLSIVSLAFSTMLFALSYICFCRDFTVDQLNLDEEDAESHEPETFSPETDDAETLDESEIIGRKIEQVMVEQHLFLRKDLKIGDLVKAVGSNRTYVSNYINTTYDCSFSDYMNRLRVEYAKNLLLSVPQGTKHAMIAAESGFATEQSFYRNFKKFVGIPPTEWQNIIRS